MIAFLMIIPLAGALAILLMPETRCEAIRKVAFFSCLATLLLSFFVFLSYRTALGGIQFEINLPWVEALGIRYHAGVDGISAVMILLHGLVSFSGAMVSYSIKERVKEYSVFFLILVASIFGVFTSLDLFFLYFFYEMAVIPMYPLIGVWGSKNKEYATMKLTLFITGGAVLALVGILAIYQAAGLESFDLAVLQSHFAANPMPLPFQQWVAAFLIFGFGVIASLWPTHSWSPIGYAAAPSAVSMLHAGVLKKLGPFLIIRLALGLVPDGARFWMPVVAFLCVVNILYAGYCAMVQKDLKFIIGFSSVSHMGYVLLGLACLNQTGVSGAVLLMFSHGVMAALTFALIGFIYDQTHTRVVEELGGGLGSRIPFIAVCFVMAAMASSGLPGFSNFIAEIMIFWGAWKQFPLPTLAAVFGILVTAVYLLRVVRNVFFGKETVKWPDPADRAILTEPRPAAGPKWPSLRDAETFAQKTPFVLLLAALLIFGFFPNLLVGKINTGVKLMADKNPSLFEVAP